MRRYGSLININPSGKNHYELLNLLRTRTSELITNKTGVINDPIGQTHIIANSEHCFRLFSF